jgi:hypothetical protein
MTFRRQKAAAEKQRSWQNFCQANSNFLQAAGIPPALYESKKNFDVFLMHGYIDLQPEITRFNVDQLSPLQQDLLVEVVVRYLQAGFADPGISGFMGGNMHQEILRRVAGD